MGEVVEFWQIYNKVKGRLDINYLEEDVPQHLRENRFVAFAGENAIEGANTVEELARSLWRQHGPDVVGKIEIYEVPEMLSYDPRNLGARVEMENSRRAEVLEFRRA